MKYVGEIERGQANLSIDVIDKIAMALEMNVSDLFDFEHETDRKELLKNIRSILNDADDRTLQTIFRVVNSILK